MDMQRATLEVASEIWSAARPILASRIPRRNMGRLCLTQPNDVSPVLTSCFEGKRSIFIAATFHNGLDRPSP